MSTKQKELIFPKWLAWIKEDKFKDVLFDIKVRKKKIIFLEYFIEPAYLNTLGIV